MARRFWGLVLSIVFVCGMGLWVSIRAASAPDEPVATTSPSPEKPTEAAPGAPATDTSESDTNVPKAVVETKFHNFGIIDPSELRAHEFRIRNDGVAPLRLVPGGASCKCVDLRLPKEPIPPGQADNVAMILNLEGRDGGFSFRGTVRTNDPTTPSIDLLETGVIRVTIAAQPASIETSSTVGMSSTSEVVLYSQIWDGFTVENGHCSLEGTTWKLLPVDDAWLKEKKAKSAQRLVVEVPAKDTYGWYMGQLEFTVVPQHDAKASSPTPSRRMTVSVSHIVRKKVGLHGARYNQLTGTLDFGTVRSWDGGKERIVLTFSDEDTTLPVGVIEAEPESLQLAVTKLSAPGGSTGVYAIDVQVPPGTPPCNYGTKQGKVRIGTDHPRIKNIEFNVRLVVSP